MARGRLISKSLGSSRKFHALHGEAGKLVEFCQALFPLIVAHTDDFGRLEADAFTIKHLVWPTSHRSELDFDGALAALNNVGLIDRYVVDGSTYLQVAHFDEHQPGLNKAKRTKSKFPEPPSISRERREIPSQEKGREGKLREEKGSEEEGNPRIARECASDALFAEFWAAYPKKKSKDDARKAWAKRRPSRELLTVMLEALQQQRRSQDWQKNGGQFIPNPATWLNGGRWQDEPELIDGMSDTMRYNLSAAEEAERIILANEEARIAREAGRGH